MSRLARQWQRARMASGAGLSGLPGRVREPCDVLWELFDKLAEAMIAVNPPGIARYLAEAKNLIAARPSAARCAPPIVLSPGERDLEFVGEYLAECERVLAELSPAGSAQYGRSLNGLEGPPRRTRIIPLRYHIPGTEHLVVPSRVFSHQYVLYPGYFSPFRPGAALYHGSTRERRVLKGPAYFSPYARIAKDFAVPRHKTQLGPFGKAVAIAGRGYLNRYHLHNVPRLLDLRPMGAYDLLCIDLAKRGLLKLHRLPPTHRGQVRYGAWYTEVSSVLAQGRIQRALDFDGWFASWPHWVEMVFFDPMRWVKFWSSTEVTVAEHVRRGMLPPSALEGLGAGVDLPVRSFEDGDELIDRMVSIDPALAQQFVEGTEAQPPGGLVNRLEEV